MKSTTATGSVSLGILIIWIWNAALPAFTGVGDWWPEMPGEVAGVLTAVFMALGARYLDGAD